jgi:hypothetical protein
VAKKRRTIGNYRDFLRHDHADLAMALRPLRPWDQPDLVRDAIYEWAGGGLRRVEAGEVANALVGLDLQLWTDSAVALLVGHRLAPTAARFGFAMLPRLEDPRDFNLTDRTRRRHGPEGIAYGYERAARREDVARLVKKGRKRGAALRWLQRHPMLHWWDAPRPRRARTRGAGPPEG